MANFKAFFISQFLGAFNDNVFKNALVILITFHSIHLFGLNSTLLVPLAGGVFIFPFFLFSGTAGQIADKYNKKTLVKIIKAWEVVVMLVAALGFFLQRYDLLMVTLFLMGTQSAFFGPVKYGILPSLVPSDSLVGANALVSGGTFIAILLGTILGGLLVSQDISAWWISGVVVVIAVIGLCSSLFLTLNADEQLQDNSAKISIDKTFLFSTWRILVMSTQRKDLLVLILGISYFWFLGAAILSQLPLIAKNVFYLSSHMATGLLALFTVGMGFGSYLTNVISRKGPHKGLIPISLLMVSFALFGFYYGVITGHLKLSFLFIFLLATFGGVFIVTQMTLLQKTAPYEILSQVIAGNNIWNALFMVVAAILLMVTNKVFGIEKSLMVFGAVSLVVSVIIYAFYKEEAFKQWSRLVASLFYRVKVVGEEHVPKEGALIVVCNHVSFVDWLFIMAYCPRNVRFVIDWQYYYMMPLTLLFRHGHLIPIATKRESEEVLKAAFRNISKSLAQGNCLGVFPEGWLSRDGKLRALQPGVDKILKNDPVPVTMIALSGLWGSFFSHSSPGVFKGGRLFKRRAVTITFSKALAPQEYSRASAKAWLENHI